VWRPTLALACSLAVAGCSFDRGWPPGENGLSTFEAGRDYYPDRVTFRHSNQLSATYHGYYKRVRLVTNSIGEEFSFVFVRRDAPLPPLNADDVVIRVPVRRYSLGSFRYGGISDLIGVTDRLVGFSNHTHATTPAIVKLFETGVLQRNTGLEAIAHRETEAHFNWYASAALSADTMARLGSLEIPAAEHLEPTPLARAEWIKFFAMFFDKEREANAAFDEIEARYTHVQRMVASATSRPRVFLNLPEGDGWHIYGGRNQLARILADAGGDYVWADSPSVESGTTAHYEEALDRGLDADIWLIGPETVGASRLANLSATNARFSTFKSVRTNRVYVNHKNYPDGPNPWWDYALIRPDEELSDLIAIFHPQLLPNHRSTFWRPLAPVHEAGSRIH
jgi:iron complex transport system substrate-binding protein